MMQRSFEVTYREGRIFAAYLHLSQQTSEKSAKTVASPDRLLIVDYAADGRPLGIELIAPHLVSLERLNALLAELGEAPMPAREYKPLMAA